VRQTWHILEQMYDHQSKILASPAIGLRFTDRDKLEGFGFMDIVSGQNPLRPRVSILKPGGRGWVDFTRSIGAISLLGRGFGDLIVPASDASKLYRAWMNVPKGEDYLVACITTLREICQKNGDINSNPLELAQGIYWHKADKLFESCSCKPNRFSQACDRIQVLLPLLSVGSKKHPDPFQNDKGAAIVGRSRRLNWHWPNVGSPVAATESEHDIDDDEKSLADSGLGTSMNTSALEASLSASTDSSQTPLTSDMSPSGLQVQRTTSWGGFQAGKQHVSGDNSILPASMKPVAQFLTSASSSREEVARNPKQSRIYDNVTASAESVNQAKPRSESPETTSAALQEHDTNDRHAGLQRYMASKTGHALQRMKSRIPRASRKLPDKAS
jgi:hypothetical protein